MPSRASDKRTKRGEKRRRNTSPDLEAESEYSDITIPKSRGRISTAQPDNIRSRLEEHTLRLETHDRAGRARDDRLTRLEASETARKEDGRIANQATTIANLRATVAKLETAMKKHITQCNDGISSAPGGRPTPKQPTIQRNKMGLAKAKAASNSRGGASATDSPIPTVHQPAEAHRDDVDSEPSDIDFLKFFHTADFRTEPDIHRFHTMTKSSRAREFRLFKIKRNSRARTAVMRERGPAVHAADVDKRDADFWLRVGGRMAHEGGGGIIVDGRSKFEFRNKTQQAADVDRATELGLMEISDNLEQGEGLPKYFLYLGEVFAIQTPTITEAIGDRKNDTSQEESGPRISYSTNDVLIDVSKSTKSLWLVYKYDLSHKRVAILSVDNPFLAAAEAGEARRQRKTTNFDMAQVAGRCQLLEGC